MTHDGQLPQTSERVRTSSSESGYQSEDDVFIATSSKINLENLRAKSQSPKPDVLHSFSGPVNSDGGTVESKGYKVIVPEGALLPGQHSDIKMTVYDTHDTRGKITNLIGLEPNGLNFRKPVEIVLPHWGWFTEEGKWEAQVSLSQDKMGETENIQWREADSKEVRNLSFNRGCCSFFLSHFTLATITLTDGGKGYCKEIIPTLFPMDDDFKRLEVKFHVLHNEKTLCEKTEARVTHNGYLVGDTTECLLVNNDEPMLMTLQPKGDHLSVENDKTKQIGFQELSNRSKNSVIFHVENKGGKDARVTLEYRIQQKNGCDQEESFNIQLNSRKLESSPQTYVLPHTATHNDLPVQELFPYRLRQNLKVYLNPESCTGNDWRRLADMIGLGRYIDRFRGQKDPLENIFKVISETRKIKSVPELRGYLVKMERLDAVEALDTFQETVTCNSRKSSSVSGYGSSDQATPSPISEGNPTKMFDITVPVNKENRTPLRDSTNIPA